MSEEEEGGTLIYRPANQTYLSGPYTIPKGLDFLLKAGHVMVRQELPSYGVLSQLNEIEGISRYEKPNRYHILNAKGDIVFTACERSNFISRLILRKRRRFTMEIKTDDGHAIATVKRPCRCPAVCGPCCGHELLIECNGKYLGNIKQRFGCCGSPYVIHDWTGAEQLLVKGPTFSCKSCVDLTLKIYAVGHYSESIGRIIRQYCRGTDNFTVIFPNDLDLRLKTLLMFTPLLLDITL